MPIYKKIQQVMQAVVGVRRDKVNTHANYKFAGHDQVTEVLRGEFARVGIVRVATVKECELLDGGYIRMLVSVSYVDVDDDTRVTVEMPTVQPSQTKAGGFTAQQVGQGLSYAIKNVEFKLFCLVGDPEQDSDAAPVERRSEAAKPAAGKEHPEVAGLLKRLDEATSGQHIDQAKARLREIWTEAKRPGLADEIARRSLAAEKRIAEAGGDV